MATKNAKQTGISSQLSLALKTGKYSVGYNQALKNVINKRTKCLIIASNFSKVKRSQLEYYCALANNIPVKYYEGNNRELSILSKLKFRTSVISILDQGESDLVEAIATK